MVLKTAAQPWRVTPTRSPQGERVLGPGQRSEGRGSHFPRWAVNKAKIPLSGKARECLGRVLQSIKDTNQQFSHSRIFSK